MRNLVYTLVFAAITFACCRSWAGGDDLKKLQGTWIVVNLTAGGKKVDIKAFDGTKFIFEKDKLTIAPANDKLDQFVKRAFAFKIDPKRQPAEIDLTSLDGENKGVVSKGIYELKDDTLRWCHPDGPETKTRPKDFSSPDKSDLYLFTLKRSK